MARSLQELISKVPGSAHISLSPQRRPAPTQGHEEDGTVVDTEEFFQTLGDNTHFMILEKGQKWMPEGRLSVDETINWRAGRWGRCDVTGVDATVSHALQGACGLFGCPTTFPVSQPPVDLSGQSQCRLRPDRPSRKSPTGVSLLSGSALRKSAAC
ncbi:hypothetical protein P7K49_028481 [Saguinus oedipus]|uniref:CIDE-N domain-containing protein n=1 Tax=Saguinus oedipus TaxID=9490 RepID=A0ABQ9UCE8_SAGOE|nr:hypothetical protein P7K49_028481 [Saguinus oedipus]